MQSRRRIGGADGWTEARRDGLRGSGAACPGARLGVTRILARFDHLLFVFLLLLLVRRARPLVGAFTAVPLARSASLGAATFVWIVVRVAPAEAGIAGFVA